MAYKLDNYNKIVDYVVGKHDVNINRTRAKMFALYFGSILANMEVKHINYEKLRENDKTINFYGMMFMPSGSGKDFGKNILISKTKDTIVGKMKKAINSINRNQIEKLGKNCLIPEKYRNKRIVDYKVTINNTDAGLYMCSLLISNSMFGSLNIEINEFGNVINKGNQIHLLNELYDGVLDIGQIQDTEEATSREPIYELKTNMLAYGSPTGMKTDERLMNNFINQVKDGLFRRSYIYYEEPIQLPEKETEDINIDDIIEQYIEEISKSLIFQKRDGKTEVKNIKEERGVKLTENAITELNKIKKILLKQYNENLENEIKAVDRSAYITILKIAGIIAILNLDDFIDGKHIIESYKIFKETRETTNRLLELKPKYEILYSKILNNMYPEHYLKSYIQTKSNKAFSELLQDTKSHAMLNNSQVYTRSQNGVVSYIVRKLEPTDDIIDFSYNISSGSQPEYTCSLKDEFIGALEDFNGWIKSQKRMITLSTALLKEDILQGYKTNKSPNNVKEISVIAFDFDNTLSVKEILNRFQGLSMLLRQSKNWSKEKAKFHLYIPLKYKIKNISKDEYKEFYENICLKFGVTDYADAGLKNIVHTLDEDPNKDAKIFDGKILDPRCCLPYTDDFEETERIYSRVKTFNRVTGYISTFIDTMIYKGSNRTGKINAWIYKFSNETENKPTKNDMLEGLEWIYSVAKENIGKGEPDRKRFAKMINENFE